MKYLKLLTKLAEHWPSHGSINKQMPKLHGLLPAFARQAFLFCTLNFVLGLSACDTPREGEKGQPCFQDAKCFTGLTCVNDRCVCEAETESELCTTNKANCGVLNIQDSCGQLRALNCGSCKAPEVCGGIGTANVCACAPLTDTELCAEANADCDQFESTDNCGEARVVICGDCSPPQTCGGSGIANQCGCVPADDNTICLQENASCGQLNITDNCGGLRTVECGQCNLPETCGGGEESQQCGCTAESNATFCQRSNANCGHFSGTDNCGTVRTDVDCGDCTTGICGGGGKNLCGDKYALVAPGNFTMGSPGTELGRDPDESPAHVVSITRPIWFSKTEINNREWANLIMTAPSSFTGCGSECPVDSVNWWEAISYLNALSVSEKLPACYTLNGCNGRSPGLNLICTSVIFAGLDCPGYRLPTEGEWEYAARGGSATSIPSGDLRNFSCATPDQDLARMGWFCGNAAVSYSPCYDSSMDITGSSTCAGTHPVGEKRANAFGLHDMIGNLWEWTNDWYGGYPANSVTDPTGAPEGTHRVVRGCAWSNGARFCRSASRNYYSPDYRFLNVGFRPVRNYSE